MIPSSLLISSLYLASLPATSAWIFSWTQPNGDLLTDHGSGAQSCQAIDNPQGNIYNWEANGDNVCIFFYGNTDCSDPSSGYTCQPWPWDNHAAGSHVLSYEVVINGTIPSSVASTTPTATTATSSTASTATTTSSSTPPAPGNTDGGSSLSGGAIAGIVVGVLAAAAIAGVLFFFLGWRRRRPSNSVSEPAPSETVMSELQAADYKPHQEPPPSSSQSLYQQQQRLRELPGSHPASEMGPGVERAELDGSPIYGKF